MEKYIGNKRVLLDTIYSFTQEQCYDANSICDIFAGTTNVARYFRNKGFDTISNDINRFSFILSECYLSLEEFPVFDKLDIEECSIEDNNTLKKIFISAVNRDKNQLVNYKDLEKTWDSLKPLINVLSYLNNLSNLEKHNNMIIDYFTVEGDKSEYTSVRGTHVKRNYFSQDNAIKINIILDKIRFWWKNKKINIKELSILLTSIIEEIVLVANVNGTFHDFNRNKLWPNALQTFKLKVPLISTSEKNHKIFNQDSIILSKNLPYIDILYLDPPYNFRQYTSYYHFINFIAAYPFLKNIEDYLSEITHVRGQNMNDEFKSPFSNKDKFIESLKYLISNTNCKYVIMSYYGGKNHWNHWSKGEVQEDEGLKVLSELFEDSELFSRNIIESTFQIRQNYQSRIGEKKEFIDEYLFFGEKITYDKNSNSLNCKKEKSYISDINQKLGLKEFVKL